ncbi:unnamed protein product [Agarophyton chilense]
MWESTDVDKWAGALSSYPAAIAMREKDQNQKDLVQLEEFVFSELPAMVKSRDPPHITKEEYGKLVRWKLKRGKWRPRLQKFADEIEDDAVREASTEALALLEKKEVKKALQKLATLRGCGPATASVILSAVEPTLPFMSDEILAAVLGQPSKYTVKVYVELMDAVQKKMSELSKKDSSKEWTAINIENAIFANHHNASKANGLHSDIPESEAKKKVSKDPTKEAEAKEKDGEKKEASQEHMKEKAPKSPNKSVMKRKASEETPKDSIEVNHETRASRIRRSKRTRRQSN